MENIAHWTQASTSAFAYSISNSFTAQLEAKMEKDGVSRTEFAERWGKTVGRVSQVLNDPGNLSLKLIVELARTLGMKVSLIAYDDGDPHNDKGPIGPDVFVQTWELMDQPRDLFQVNDIASQISALRVAVDRGRQFVQGAIGKNQYALPSLHKPPTNEHPLGGGIGAGQKQRIKEQEVA